MSVAGVYNEGTLAVASVQFNACGDSILTSSSSGAVSIWDIGPEPELEPEPEPQS